MERIDPVFGPIRVTETMRKLGLKNTFLAGYFFLNAPLLREYVTDANQRPDLSTSPDRYNQTTASDIGALLGDMYACGNGGGTLLAAFPGEITVEECRMMLDLLAENKIGVLIEAGVPDGTRVAHKHGWTDSPLTWVGDAGIVYSPAGDYVLDPLPVERSGHDLGADLQASWPISRARSTTTSTRRPPRGERVHPGQAATPASRSA